MNSKMSKLLATVACITFCQCAGSSALHKQSSPAKIIGGDTLSYYSADSTDSWYFTLDYFKKALAMNLPETLFTGVKIYWLQPSSREYMIKLIQRDSVPLLNIYYPVGVTITEAIADSLGVHDSIKNIASFSAIAGCHQSLKKLPLQSYTPRIIIQKVSLVDSSIAKTYQAFLTGFGIDSMKSVARKNRPSPDTSALIVEVYKDSLVNRFKFFAGDTIDTRYSWIVRNVRGLFR